MMDLKSTETANALRSLAIARILPRKSRDRKTRLHWGFPDPAAATGTKEEKLKVFRAVRDSIKATVQDWCKQLREREAANKSH